MTDPNQGHGLGYQHHRGQGQGQQPGVRDTLGHNYFRIVWDDDEEADDVPTPPQHRKDYPEAPALPPDILPAPSSPEVHSGIAHGPTDHVPRLEAPPSHPNPHRSPTRPTSTRPDTLTINKNLYNLTHTGGLRWDGPQVGGLRWDGPQVGTRPEEVVLGVNTVDAVYSSPTRDVDPAARGTYPALAGVDGGDKGAAGLPMLQYPGIRTGGGYESSGIKRPLSPLRVKPNTLVSDVGTTHVSLLSDDENILAADDADMRSPFTPDHGAILAPPVGGGLNRLKRRRMIIWALIICAAMVIAGLVTYLSVRGIRGW